MHRFVNTLALTAAALTLGAGLWQDWGLFATMKKMILAYLGFFFLGAVLTLAIISVPVFEGKTEADGGQNKQKETSTS